jgi:hypothetical protein
LTTLSAEGGLLFNHRNLELLLRVLLAARGNDPSAALLKAQFSVGDFIRLSTMTDFATMGQVIERFNREVEKIDSQLKVDAFVAELRDAFAHGRMLEGPDGF